MIVNQNYADWSIKALYWTGGALSTVICAWLSSWLSNKTRIYHDTRNSHRDEIHENILAPMHSALQSQGNPQFSINWQQQRYNSTALAHESPTIFGKTLRLVGTPPINSRNFDEALFEDAKTHHYLSIISSWENFNNAWCAHIISHHTWIEEMAEEVLRKSELPQHSQEPFLDKYVSQLGVALFIYHRLRGIGQTNLTIEKQLHQQVDRFDLHESHTVLATGSEQEMKQLMALVEELRKSHMSLALRIQQELAYLDMERVSLSRQLSLAIAGKKLRGRCPLVNFF